MYARTEKMINEAMEDPELVERINETNDPYWFGILYDRHIKTVYNKCLFLLQDTTDAEDITHDIFLKVFVSLKQFKGNSQFKTWLLAITYNFCISFMRKKNLDIQIDENQLPDMGSETEDSEFLRIRIVELQTALQLIKPEEKMILLMKYQDDMSISEIAEALDLGESAVKMRLKRSKNKVMELSNTV